MQNYSNTYFFLEASKSLLQILEQLSSTFIYKFVSAYTLSADLIVFLPGNFRDGFLLKGPKLCLQMSVTK